jgi:hypothetical protein
MAVYVDNEGALVVDGFVLDNGLLEDLSGFLDYLIEYPQDKDNSTELLECVEGYVAYTRLMLDKLEGQVKQLKK